MSRRGSIVSFSGDEPPRKKRQTEWIPISPQPVHASVPSAPSTTAPPSRTTQFEFVDALSAGSRSVVQRHSMRHYLRQKRLREIETLRSSAPIGLQWQVRQPVENDPPRVSSGRVTLEDILSEKDSLSTTSVSTSPSPGLDISSQGSGSRGGSTFGQFPDRTAGTMVSSKRLSRSCPPGPVQFLYEQDEESSPDEIMEDVSGVESEPSSTTLEYESDSIPSVKLGRSRHNRYALWHMPRDTFTDIGQSDWSYSPGSLLGAGKVDPFATYPIILDSVDLNLTDYYISSRCTRASHATFFRRIVADALQDPAAFHLFLAYSAHHVSSLKEYTCLNSRAIMHKKKGIKLINKRLSTWNGLQDDNIQAILLMLAIENAFGSEQASSTHIDGLRKMIASQGGLPSLESPWLLLQVCWTEMTGTGRMSMDCLPSCDSGLISNSLSTYLSCPALSSGVDLYPDQSLASLCDSFVFSLQEYQLLSFMRQSAGTEMFFTTPYEASQCVSVLLAFVSGTSLRKLLVLPKDPRGRTDIISIRDQCHLASLIYMHASLWEFRRSAASTDQFIETLKSQLVTDDLDERHGSIEALLWAVLTDGLGNRLVSPARTQRVLQMMAVARRLKRESWDTIQDILLQGLSVRHWSEVGVLDARWDAEKIKAEALFNCGSIVG